MAKNKIIQKIVDKFLIGKEGPSVLKNIEEKKLVDSGILDSMDILLLATEIEKKTNFWGFIRLVHRCTWGSYFFVFACC